MDLSAALLVGTVAGVGLVLLVWSYERQIAALRADKAGQQAQLQALLGQLVVAMNTQVTIARAQAEATTVALKPSLFASSDLQNAVDRFLAEMVDLDTPECLDKAKELRLALRQPEPNIEQIQRIRYFFRGRPNPAKNAAEVLFQHPALQLLLQRAVRNGSG